MHFLHVSHKRRLKLERGITLLTFKLFVRKTMFPPNMSIKRIFFCIRLLTLVACEPQI